MGTNSMMTSSNGNIFRVTGHLCGEFTAQRPETRAFDVFFDLHPNKRLSKQWWGWWFETRSCPLWRHRNVDVLKLHELTHLPTNATYLRQWIRPALVQVIACRIFGTKPLCKLTRKGLSTLCEKMSIGREENQSGVQWCEWGQSASLGERPTEAVWRNNTANSPRKRTPWISNHGYGECALCWYLVAIVCVVIDGCLLQRRCCFWLKLLPVLTPAFRSGVSNIPPPTDGIAWSVVCNVCCNSQNTR